MEYKSLHLGADLRESINYQDTAVPLLICTSRFDDYFQSEWTCHWHNEFEFAVVVRGRAKYIIYDGAEVLCEQELCEGDGIFISAGTFHSAKALAPDTIVSDAAFPITFFDMKPFDSCCKQNIHPIIDSGITHIALYKNNKENAPVLSAINELCRLEKSEIGYDIPLRSAHNVAESVYNWLQALRDLGYNW